MKPVINTKEIWTTVISSKKKWFDINLNEIIAYKDLIFVLVKRDIVSIYKQTVLGPIWFLFGPLFTVFTYTFAFSTIANISTDGIPAPVFYLAGTILWSYFQACFQGASNTFNSNANIFGKVYFPRLIPSISLVFSNLLKLGIQFIIFVFFSIFYIKQGLIHPNMYVFLLPVLIIIMAIMGLGVGLILSSMTVKYRDVNQLIGPLMMLLMYSSPIIYPSSSVPTILKPYLSLNPIVPIIDAFRYAFTGAGSISLLGLLYSMIFSIFILLIGVILFNRVEKNFIDSI
jgi:lipopolysaccharide transport system permease protein